MMLLYELLYWLSLPVMVLLAFRFPANLIDALKLENRNAAQLAREKACADFGFLMLGILLHLTLFRVL